MPNGDNGDTAGAHEQAMKITRQRGYSIVLSEQYRGRGLASRLDHGGVC